MPRFPRDIRNCFPAGMAGDRINDRPGPCPWHEGGECVSKHRHGGGAKSGRQAGGSPEERERRARAFLENGRFRDAIEEFKALLSRDPREEWKEGLARSYADHAEALAGKGMVEEALVVWQNRSRICGKPLMEGPWFEWVRASKSGEATSSTGFSGRGSFRRKTPKRQKISPGPSSFFPMHFLPGWGSAGTPWSRFAGRPGRLFATMASESGSRRRSSRGASRAAPPSLRCDFSSGRSSCSTRRRMRAPGSSPACRRPPSIPSSRRQRSPSSPFVRDFGRWRRPGTSVSGAWRWS